MESSVLEKLLTDWNPHFTNVRRGAWHNTVPREKYLQKLQALINIRHVLILTGVRRAGKSVLMSQLMGWLIEEKNVPPENIVYLFLEDVQVSQYLELGASFLTSLYEYYIEKYNPQGKVYFFLDEIQGVKNFNRWIATLYERQANIKFVISGSQQSLIESESSTVLTGRNIQIDVHPFNFAEYLQLQKVKIAGSLKTISSVRDSNFHQQSSILYHLRKFLHDGGFPEVILAESDIVKRSILAGYYRDMLNRDVINPNQLRNSRDVEMLGTQLLTDFTQTHTLRSLGRANKLNIETVKDYLEYFYKAYLFSESTYFSYKTKETQDIIRPRKIYVVDNGLRNFIVPQLRPDLGQCAENLVYQELKKRKVAVYYWKGKKEVDFVTLNPNLELYNVSYTDQPPDRETEGMLEAMTEFKQKQGVILTKNYSASVDIDGKKIDYIPLWAWLLTDQDQAPIPSP